MDDRSLEVKAQKAFRLPTVPYYWENFLMSVLLHLSLPLLPLLVEFFQTGKVSLITLSLAASMYAISIGVSSRSRLLFAINVVLSLLFAFLYGSLLGKTSMDHVVIKGLYELGVFFVFLSHAAERYNRHVADRAPFFEFMSN